MIRAISFGGGVQSTALCVLATQGVIQADVAVFANVGVHAENPETLAYVEWFIPWANEHGLETVERHWWGADGRKHDLFDDHMKDRRTIDLPVRFHGGGFGNRKCTDRYKIRVVERELRRRGASETDKAETMIGISTDEWHRANRLNARAWEIPTFPLLDLGYSRTDCARIIAEAGLPVPPESACWFCPFQGPKGWERKRLEDPEAFERGIVLETQVNKIRRNLGRDEVYLGQPGVLLKDMVDPPDEADQGLCDSGYCWT